MKAALLVLCLWPSIAVSESLKLIQPTELHIRGEQYEVLRDPYIPQYENDWTYGAALGTSLDLISYSTWALYYAPTLKFRATESQIRQGGLEYQTGMTYSFSSGMSLDVFKYHESLHCLECNATTEDGRSTSKAFPLVESYGLELKWRIK